MTTVVTGRSSRHDELGLVLPDALLSAEDEVRLAEQIEAGVLAAAARSGRMPSSAGAAELIMLEWLGRRAARTYVECNLRLVAMVSRREAIRSGLPEGDLFQEGCLGLIEAVQRFDHRRGPRFATYALYWIRARIVAVTATRNGELDLPPGRAEAAREARGLQALLNQELGREVTAGELAAQLGRDPAEVARLLQHTAHQALDPIDPVVEVPDDAAAADLEVVLQQRMPGVELLDHLSGLDRRVIELRYGFDDGTEHSISEVARRLQIPRTRARRHELAALETLRARCPQQLIAHLR